MNISKLVPAFYFYPRSPCGERPIISKIDTRRSVFLSTLSLRRATCGCSARCRYWGYFYPRSPCGERLVNGGGLLSCFDISIHALLAESDAWHRFTMRRDFISIHALLAESDLTDDVSTGGKIISIHALLAESDTLAGLWVLSTRIFLSTLSLRRATTEGSICLDSSELFLSTLSLRRATESAPNRPEEQ